MKNHIIPKVARVLIVDDDDVVPAAITHFSKEFGYGMAFDYAWDAGRAVEKLNGTCYDAAVIDVLLPGVSGISLGAIVRERDVNIPLIYFTNLDTAAVRVEAVAQRAFFLKKFDYIGTDRGMDRLLKIIAELVLLNPCVAGDRIDNHGFPRQLPDTPIVLPPALDDLLKYSRAQSAAA